ncbi:MAG: cell division protein FtsL [Paracoccaceae bacterium]
MRFVLHAMTFLTVIGLAVWAYHENYKTQAVLSEVELLEDRMARAHARLSVLRAEWAYLNRPDRLRDLAEMSFERLELLPLRADQFGAVDEVPYPRAAPLDVQDPIDVARIPPNAAPNAASVQGTRP